jgi:uncharacterized membrane protein
MPPLIVIGAALGGAVMFFLDPEKGRRRRAWVRDQAISASSNVRTFVDSGKRDLLHRGSVATGRLHAMITRRPASDSVLVDRVRSKMGHYVAHSSAIEVTASGGEVTLSGSIPAHEHDELVDGVSRVKGVTAVFDGLTVYEKAEGLSDVSGRERDEAAQESWAPGTRLVSSAAGTTLTLYALARRSRFGGLVALATGVALLARSATNKPLAKLAGMRGYKGIDVQKTINIDAPVEEVFKFLANYDNFPQFMRNVKSVETFADGRSHWKVAGPAGVIVEWESITTRIEPNELIEWSTIEGSTVEHAGSIDFEPAGQGTRVRLEMSYNPPAGALGHVVAKLFGADPKSELDEDMLRLKSALEARKAPRDAAARESAAENTA